MILKRWVKALCLLHEAVSPSLFKAAMRSFVCVFMFRSGARHCHACGLHWSDVYYCGEVSRGSLSTGIQRRQVPTLHA